MLWIYTGYFGTYLLGFLVYLFYEAASDRFGRMQLLAGFLIAGVFSACLAEFAIGLSDERQAILRSRVKTGQISKFRLVISGFTLALVTGVLVSLIFLFLPERWLFANLILSGLVIFSSPTLLVLHFGRSKEIDKTN